MASKRREEEEGQKKLGRTTSSSFSASALPLGQIESCTLATERENWQTGKAKRGEIVHQKDKERGV